MQKYEEIKIEEKLVGIRRVADGASIPLDEDNRDYADYLAWVSEQELVITAP